MKLVFMGTPEFAVPCLERLQQDGHDILAVFTQPDKPKDRGHFVASPPVKLKALEKNIHVYQPVSLKDGEALELLKMLSPEIIIVVAYGKILPLSILSLPRYGCINIHASLLPKYRGAAPVQWSIINGETVTGVTSMQLDEGMDTGDMLLAGHTEIGADETSGDLFGRLSALGADILSETISGIREGSIIPVKQDNSEATYAPMLTKSLCSVNWDETALKVHNKIRGLAPFLTATTVYKGKIIRIHSTQVVENSNGKPGEVVINAGRLVVACAHGTAIEIKTLQAEGKRAMNADEFLRGNKIDIGTIFGS